MAILTTNGHSMERDTGSRQVFFIEDKILYGSSYGFVTGATRDVGGRITYEITRPPQNGYCGSTVSGILSEDITAYTEEKHAAAIEKSIRDSAMHSATYKKQQDECVAALTVLTDEQRNALLAFTIYPNQLRDLLQEQFAAKGE